MKRAIEALCAAASTVGGVAFLLYGAYNAREVTHPRCEVFVPNYRAQIKAAQQPNDTQKKWFRMCRGDPMNPLAPITKE
jgi:hypothetical protein